MCNVSSGVTVLTRDALQFVDITRITRLPIGQIFHFEIRGFRQLRKREQNFLTRIFAGNLTYHFNSEIFYTFLIMRFVIIERYRFTFEIISIEERFPSDFDFSFFFFTYEHLADRDKLLLLFFAHV